MNSVTAIARTDIADAIHSRTLWGATGLMTVLVAISWVGLSANLVEQADTPLLTAIDSFGLWVPLVAIVLGYEAVIGERESGRIRFHLGLPSTRRELIVGKYLSRVSVLVTALVVSTGVLVVLVFVRVDEIPLVPLLSAVILLALYGLAWIGMAVGVSSVVSSKTRAVAAVVGLYALFGPLWGQIVLPACTRFVQLLTGTTQSVDFARLTYADGPTWFLYVARLSPLEAFDAARYYIRDLLEIALMGGRTTAAHGPNLFGLAVLLCWAIVPVALGVWFFDRVDLE
ncbi:ABC transporter permease subunit [Natrialba asiatica]|uniref:Copper ABC transporter permease n=1 Tax=Natrialba asiatica (strain ATCC 700177 / DSM 12278 / JCM 9576 / FERM P-10747 / NBRC 102637 / 172P1) TaxID=29540 RepID=M0B3Q2_NATA1|nr:ABC transporter permease subunit [Natrialba asiatica]ELZ04873.1 copper ABC transporter permease [Natrialba asiatica DSM 12278]